jgi:methyl-accepting chemotaxis protein
MSESTEKLTTAVKGASETLGEVGTLAQQLSSAATELADQAAEHGWHGIATRMNDVAEALDTSTSQIETSKEARAKASEELGLINDKIPTEQVVGHLVTSTTQLREAVTALDGAVENTDGVAVNEPRRHPPALHSQYRLK